MHILPRLLLLAAAATTLAATAARAETYDPKLDRQRYEGCVRALEVDAVKAEQFAVEWQARGGGLPARHCQALAQLHRGQYAAAAQTLVKAAEAAETAKSPMAADFWGQAGNAAFLAGDSKGAVAHFTTAITAVPDAVPARRAALLIDRARAETDLGDLVAARADLDKALALSNDEPLAWMLSAALARRQGDMLRASHDISRASAMAPTDPDIMFEQGNIAFANHDEATARLVWQRVIQAAPGSEAASLAAKTLADEKQP